MTATGWRSGADRAANDRVQDERAGSERPRTERAVDDPSDDAAEAGGGLPPAGRTRRRVAVVVALVVVFGVFATWLVAYSPVFGVGTVEVHGTRTLSKAKVENAADVDYGQPVVRVDTAAITERVEKLPQVESAQVSTSFPDTVEITVVERRPVGYVTIGGRHLLVDHEGVRFQTVETAPTGLPSLVLPDGSAPGAKATADAVARVADALPAPLLRRTRSIEALDARTITVVLRGGMVVRWGSADASRQKAAVVDALRLRRHAPVQVDVTDPARPFTR